MNDSAVEGCTVRLRVLFEDLQGCSLREGLSGGGKLAPKCYIIFNKNTYHRGNGCIISTTYSAYLAPSKVGKTQAHFDQSCRQLVGSTAGAVAAGQTIFQIQPLGCLACHPLTKASISSPLRWASLDTLLCFDSLRMERNDIESDSNHSVINFSTRMKLVCGVSDAVLLRSFNLDTDQSKIIRKGTRLKFHSVHTKTASFPSSSNSMVTAKVAPVEHGHDDHVCS